jgi:hypothetical protein
MTTLIPKFKQPQTGAVNRDFDLKLDEYVAVTDFGAVGNGTGDDSTAIQNAINTGKAVYFPVGTYNITTTIFFKNNGQILFGEGCGYDSTNEPGRTIIKWTGTSGGTMISFHLSAVTGAINNASIRDMDFDGGSALAQIGVEVFRDGATGGCWRNELRNVVIRNITGGASPRGLELGHSGTAPNFANDFKMYSGAIQNCTKGVWVNGSTEHFYNVTVGNCSDAGIYAEAGAMLGLFGCIFSNNGTDIKAYNVQSITSHGGWFEDSTNGVYAVVAGSTQNSCAFFGSFLSTFSATNLMFIGSAAGGVTLSGCFVPTTSSSTLVNQVNGTFPFALTGNTNVTWSTSTTQTGVQPFFGKTNFGSSNGQQNAVYQASLAPSGTLSLPLSVSNQSFIGFVVAGHYSIAAPAQRTTTTYSVFYFQGDNTTITSINSANGSSSGLTFTLTASSNNLVFTNTSSATSNAYIAAIGSGLI